MKSEKCKMPLPAIFPFSFSTFHCKAGPRTGGTRGPPRIREGGRIGTARAVRRRDTDPRLERPALSAEHRRDTRRRTRGARARGFSPSGETDVRRFVTCAVEEAGRLGDARLPRGTGTPCERAEPVARPMATSVLFVNSNSVAVSQTQNDYGCSSPTSRREIGRCESGCAVRLSQQPPHFPIARPALACRLVP